VACLTLLLFLLLATILSSFLKLCLVFKYKQAFLLLLGICPLFFALFEPPIGAISFQFQWVYKYCAAFSEELAFSCIINNTTRTSSIKQIALMKE